MRISAYLAPVAFVLSAAAVNAAVGTSVGDHIPAFSAKAVDVSGAEPKSRDLDSQKTAKPTVYLFVGTQCGTTQSYVERLRELEKAYGERGVDFVYVYPNKTDSSEAKSAFHKEKKFTGAMVDDQGGAIARTLGAQRTAEAVVASKEGEIVYRGAIDDAGKAPANVKQRYLALALDAHLAGKPVAITTAPVEA